MAKAQPRIKAALAPSPLEGEDERIVLIIKGADRDQFQDLLMKVRALPGAKFDWDEKVWHVAATKKNADRIIALGSEEHVEIAPLLAAWISDRSVLQRLAVLEAAVAQLQEAASATAAEPPF